jgi:hypothetical protein
MTDSLYYFILVTLFANWWLLFVVILDKEKPPVQRNTVAFFQLLYCVWGTVAFWHS